jgi:DNA-binding response OmpR family regulator
MISVEVIRENVYERCMKPITVIYIEDEPFEAELFGMGLSPRGINVLHIPDAEVQSLRVLEQPEYQAAKAIFIDMWIGGMNGMEIARQLRERGDERPFFLLTAADRPKLDSLRELNLNYILKPANYRELAEKIRALE